METGLLGNSSELDGTPGLPMTCGTLYAHEKGEKAPRGRTEVPAATLSRFIMKTSILGIITSSEVQARPAQGNKPLVESCVFVLHCLTELWWKTSRFGRICRDSMC